MISYGTVGAIISIVGVLGISIGMLIGFYLDKDCSLMHPSSDEDKDFFE